MPLRTYNIFYQWVKQDDFLTNGASFIEHKNVNGLQDWYGIQLWPKVNKQITTGTDAMIGINWPRGWTIYLWGDNGAIYKTTSTDNVPEHSLSATKHIVQVISDGNDLYFFWKSNKASANIWLAYITQTNADAGSWGAMNETLETEGQIANRGTPPYLIAWNSIFIGGLWNIKTLSNTWYGATTYSFPDTYVVGLTLQGSTIAVYCESGNIYFWDGGSTTESARTYLGSRIARVGSKWSINYVVTEDGQLYIWSGTQFIRVSKPKLSDRMNDNASFDTRLSFIPDESNSLNNHSLITVLDDVYIASDDTTRGIYKYGKLIPWMQDGLHKILTENNTGTQISQIYDTFYDSSSKKLYISYKAGTTYGVDYIDLSSMGTTTDGYFITDVFSWGTSQLKEIKNISIATENTSWNNYIKLYYRVDNGSWELIKTINDSTNTVHREDIRTIAWIQYKHFIDLQLKVELHMWDTTSPIMRELQLEYWFTK